MSEHESGDDAATYAYQTDGRRYPCARRSNRRLLRLFARSDASSFEVLRLVSHSGPDVGVLVEPGRPPRLVALAALPALDLAGSPLEESEGA